MSTVISGWRWHPLCLEAEAKVGCIRKMRHQSKVRDDWLFSAAYSDHPPGHLLRRSHDEVMIARYSCRHTHPAESMIVCEENGLRRLALMVTIVSYCTFHPQCLALRLGWVNWIDSSITLTAVLNAYLTRLHTFLELFLCVSNIFQKNENFLLTQ